MDIMSCIAASILAHTGTFKGCEHVLRGIGAFLDLSNTLCSYSTFLRSMILRLLESCLFIIIIFLY